MARYTEGSLRAGVVKLADARDSKSRSLRGVWVRFPPPAPTNPRTILNSRPPAEAGIGPRARSSTFAATVGVSTAAAAGTGRR